MEILNQSKKKIRTVKFTIFWLVVFSAVFVSCKDDDAMPPWEAEIAQLRAAVEPLKNFESAKTAGWDIQATEYRTGMGFHYLNAGLLDTNFEVDKPEVLIFIEDSSGGMELVAVEYGYPIDDLNNPPPAPEGFSGDDDIWKIDTEFSLWTLHAWVVMDNPDGIFAPMNPSLP